MTLLATLTQATRDHGAGALVGLAAIAVMSWLGRRPRSFWEDQPREEPPPSPPVTHLTPTQVRILRPGRQLDRRDRWGSGS